MFYELILYMNHSIGIVANEAQGIPNLSQYLAYVVLDFLDIVLYALILILD